MITLEINSKDKENIVKQANKHRLANKNKWYQLLIEYRGHVVKIKAYNTWIQIGRIYLDDELMSNNPGPMDISPTEFKGELRKMLHTIEVFSDNEHE